MFHYQSTLVSLIHDFITLKSYKQQQQKIVKKVPIEIFEKKERNLSNI